ncbi:LysR family transcriptional regulator [Sorangium sp. So ce861]|uniref:LysR family transcriptional regulator n=1 Tax=Sorangium sp. So ce861 TaxID=3133323 RepID=UPI003F638E97
MAVFVAVVEHRSFTAAAQALGMTKSMVSQHVRQLEAGLGVTLMQRTTRSMSLTEAGEIYHATASRILRDAEQVHSRRVVANHGVAVRATWTPSSVARKRIGVRELTRDRRPAVLGASPLSAIAARGQIDVSFLPRDRLPEAFSRKASYSMSPLGGALE